MKRLRINSDMRTGLWDYCVCNCVFYAPSGVHTHIPPPITSTAARWARPHADYLHFVMKVIYFGITRVHQSPTVCNANTRTIDSVRHRPGLRTCSRTAPLARSLCRPSRRPPPPAGIAGRAMQNISPNLWASSVRACTRADTCTHRVK